VLPAKTSSTHHAFSHLSLFYLKEYVVMSDLSPERPWEYHDPYSLDVPAHPLYLAHEQANTLDMLVTPSPSELQAQLMQAYHEVKALGIAPVLFIHAESMQTEKTKNMKLFAWNLQQQGRKTLCILPQNGIGDERQKGENPDTGFIISRAFPERKTPALILRSNSLHQIKDQLVQKGITPATTEVICIDEVQLCTSQTPFEAIAGLLELQQAGFTVVINGIDYDFKADRFSHMHHLLLMSRFLPGWKTFQLSTLCRHCPNPAHGSRRVITFPDGKKAIADATSPIVMPGLSDYYAVCDLFHKPCTRLEATEEHVRPPLPTTLALAHIQQIPWMQETVAYFKIHL
jgi:thymidine kinase